MLGLLAHELLVPMRELTPIHRPARPAAKHHCFNGLVRAEHLYRGYGGLEERPSCGAPYAPIATLIPTSHRAAMGDEPAKLLEIWANLVVMALQVIRLVHIGPVSGT